MARVPNKRNRPDEAPQGKLKLATAFIVDTLGVDKLSPPNVLMYGNAIHGIAGPLSAGHPIDEPIEECASGELFLKALERCGSSYNLTQTQGGLSLRAGVFRAVVPCAPIDTFPHVFPDPMLGPLAPPILAAMLSVLSIAAPRAERVYQCAVHLTENVAVATNGIILTEAWHGFRMPTVNLPQEFVAAIKRSKAAIVGFGVTVERSFTVHFDNGGWLKTHLYEDKFPNYERVFTAGATPVGIPPTLFHAIDHVAPFCKEDVIYFNDGFVATSSDRNGSYFDVEGLSANLCFNPELFKHIPKEVVQMSVNPSSPSITFYGLTTRTVVMGRRR